MSNAPRTGHSPTGRKTALRIARAAEDILRNEGLGTFSMRAVAKRAGVRLANLQYYYATTQDLVRAIIDLNTENYREAYRRVGDAAKENPREQFEAILRFNLQDISNASTRRFFIHLWPLLESMDGASGNLLAQLYSTQTGLLGAQILAMHAGVSEDEARRRAELIAALIEGLFITLPPTAQNAADIEEIEGRVMRLSLAIADGQF